MRPFSSGTLFSPRPVNPAVLRDQGQMNSRIVIFVVSFLLSFTGCQTEHNIEQEGGSPEIASSDERGARLHVWTHHPYSKMKTIEPVSEAIIQREFDKIDWSGPSAKHSLVLSLSDKESISIDGVVSPANQDDSLRAHWMGARRDSEGRWDHLHAEPLDSPETALQILVARFRNDTSIDSLADWK